MSFLKEEKTFCQKSWSHVSSWNCTLARTLSEVTEMKVKLSVLPGFCSMTSLCAIINSSLFHSRTVLHLNAKLRGLPEDLRRSPRATRSPCNDIRSIICLLSLCHSIYLVCNMAYSLRMLRKLSIMDENTQYESFKWKPEHCNRVGCSEAQVSTTKSKEMARNSLEMQLPCCAFCSASLHWAGAAWEGHGFRCFITIVYIKITWQND